MGGGLIIFAWAGSAKMVCWYSFLHMSVRSHGWGEGGICKGGECQKNGMLAFFPPYVHESEIVWVGGELNATAMLQKDYSCNLIGAWRFKSGNTVKVIGKEGLLPTHFCWEGEEVWAGGSCLTGLQVLSFDNYERCHVLAMRLFTNRGGPIHLRCRKRALLGTVCTIEYFLLSTVYHFTVKNSIL